MRKFLFLVVMLGALSGCDELDYGNQLARSVGVESVKDVGRGYYEYTLESGKVKCREHSRRAELTCWKL